MKQAKQDIATLQWHNNIHNVDKNGFYKHTTE